MSEDKDKDKSKKKPTLGPKLSTLGTGLEKKAALEAIKDGINKEFGPGTASTKSDTSGKLAKWMATGILPVDWAGGLGVPHSRIVEIFGPESSGKTTLLLHLMGIAQRLGGICAFIDMEHALDPEWGEKVGVDIDELIVAQPDSAEDALELMEGLGMNPGIHIAGLDSIARLVPRAELEAQTGESHMGLQARLMSQHLRKAVTGFAKTNVITIYLNQIRMKIGVMFGSPETTCVHPETTVEMVVDE